jgi:hypothetical protein
MVEGQTGGQHRLCGHYAERFRRLGHSLAQFGRNVSGSPCAIGVQLGLSHIVWGTLGGHRHTAVTVSVRTHAAIQAPITQFSRNCAIPQNGDPPAKSLTCHLADDFRRHTDAGARTLEPD